MSASTARPTSRSLGDPRGELNLEPLPQRESVFALSNGHIGLRGNLDEGEPHGLPGTYLNGVYERARCPTRRPATGSPRTGRPSSTSPTAS